MNRYKLLAGALLMAGGFQMTGDARIASAEVERRPDGTLEITWVSPNPVDVYAKEGVTAKGSQHRELVKASLDGRYVVPVAERTPHHFLLVDRKDRHELEVAERVVPLAQASNFRDIGGYVGAGGKRVRWGYIFRSGGQALLTPEDVEHVKALGIAQLIDLRSSEERAMAPSKITDVPYAAVGYSMRDLLRKVDIPTPANGAVLYRNLPHLLVPHLRLVFESLLTKQQPILYNCSAGQDRTGFVTAMILSALGVDYATIVADYDLSTRYRRPEFEMPPLDPAVWSKDPAGQLFLRFQQMPEWKVPQPLKDDEGPFLRGAFDEIREKWGSVDAYLEQAVGVTQADLRNLRKRYLQ